MQTEKSIQQDDRRRGQRRVPTQAIRVSRAVSVLPISDARVLNLSRSGVAIRTGVPLRVGDRLSFTVSTGAPPILAEVLASDRTEEGDYVVRCRCLLGGFDVV